MPPATKTLAGKTPAKAKTPRKKPTPKPLVERKIDITVTLTGTGCNGKSPVKVKVTRDGSKIVFEQEADSVYDDEYKAAFEIEALKQAIEMASEDVVAMPKPQDATS